MSSDKRILKQQICLECQNLRAENEKLRREIDRLNRLMFGKPTDNQQNDEEITAAAMIPKPSYPITTTYQEPIDYSSQAAIPTGPALNIHEYHSEIVTKESSLAQKIALFRSIFRGREDVYARRFDNKKSGKSGYAPACQNEWKPGICPKPKIRCQDCHHKDYLALNDQIIESHFRGKIVVGIYPLLTDDRMLTYTSLYLNGCMAND